MRPSLSVEAIVAPAVPRAIDRPVPPASIPRRRGDVGTGQALFAAVAVLGPPPFAAARGGFGLEPAAIEHAPGLARPLGLTCRGIAVSGIAERHRGQLHPARGLLPPSPPPTASIARTPSGRFGHEKGRTPGCCREIRPFGGCLRLLNGGRGGNRTPDTGIFNPLLYQLSYPATSEREMIRGRGRQGKPAPG